MPLRAQISLELPSWKSSRIKTQGYDILLYEVLLSLFNSVITICNDVRSLGRGHKARKSYDEQKYAKNSSMEMFACFFCIFAWTSRTPKNICLIAWIFCLNFLPKRMIYMLFLDLPICMFFRLVKLPVCIFA